MRNLLEFIAKYNHWFLFMLLEAISLVLLFRYNSYQGSVWLSSANVVSGKLYEWESDLGAFFNLTTLNKELSMRNFCLERQVAQLHRLYGDATGDTTWTEKEQLSQMSKYDLIPAEVVSNTINRPDNLITINRGSADGVRPDMGVVCGQGVVGVVYLVSSHYSVVIPAINARASSISCTIRNRGYFGYLRWTGGDPTIAYVEDIPRHAKFNPHSDWVVTSGYSSIFPPGVMVGRIVNTYNSSDGLSYRLKVHLTTDFARLRDVFVIGDTTVAERARLLEAARDSLKPRVN